eukprot:852906-Rhodomonas_salina.1
MIVVLVMPVTIDMPVMVVTKMIVVLCSHDHNALCSVSDALALAHLHNALRLKRLAAQRPCRSPASRHARQYTGVTTRSKTH